jgi:hypothetical protein
MTALPAGAQETLRPLLEMAESLTKQIHVYDERLGQIARTQYPETQLLQQVTRSRNFDRSHVCVDSGRSVSLPAQPGCGLLRRSAFETGRFRR